MEQRLSYLEKHHIVPRCLGGSDDPSNIVELTFEEHVEAHHILHLRYPHHKGLKAAFLLMSGQTEEGRKALLAYAHEQSSKKQKGRPQTPEHVKNKADSKRGNHYPKHKAASTGSKNGMYGKQTSLLQKAVASQTFAGKPKTRFSCLFCKKECTTNNRRYHASCN
jgi:hypothetical protein